MSRNEGRGQWADKDTGGGGTSVHNDLTGLQGGTAGQYYHLTSAEHTLVQALDPDLATFSVPDNTLVSAFSKTLLDEDSQGAWQTALDVDPAGTDNSTDVTLVGTPDYITITGQQITRNPVDLGTDMTGSLPIGDLDYTGTSNGDHIEISGGVPIWTPKPTGGSASTYANDHGEWTRMATGTGNPTSGKWRIYQASGDDWNAPANVVEVSFHPTNKGGDVLWDILSRINIGTALRFEESADPASFAVYRCVAPSIMSEVSNPRVRIKVEFIYSSAGFTFGSSSTDYLDYKISTAGLGATQQVVESHSALITMANTTDYYTFVQNDGYASHDYSRSLGTAPTTGLSADDMGWSPTQDCVLNSVILQGRAGGTGAFSAQIQYKFTRIRYSSNTSTAPTYTDLATSGIFAFDFVSPYNPVNFRWPTSTIEGTALQSNSTTTDRFVVSFKRQASQVPTTCRITISYEYVING